MPYTREQWKASFDGARRKIAEADMLIQASETGKVAPVGIEPDDARYQTDMPAGQKSALRARVTLLVNEVIADFQTGLA